jgi:NADH-quinone oxidoreductase subunit M
MLMLQTGMLGVLISLDFFMFYVFWEVMLVAMSFLIGVWGGPRRLYAAIKFFLYTLVGSVLLLLGILALYFIYPIIAAQHPDLAAQFGATPTFNVLAFHAMAQYLPCNFRGGFSWPSLSGLPSRFQCSRFTWLPDAREAPAADLSSSPAFC